jgi:redox-sensitive bicupin YhaK (pirin superfamily)
MTAGSGIISEMPQGNAAGQMHVPTLGNFASGNKDDRDPRQGVTRVEIQKRPDDDGKVVRVTGEFGQTRLPWMALPPIRNT